LAGADIGGGELCFQHDDFIAQGAKLGLERTVLLVAGGEIRVELRGPGAGFGQSEFEQLL
jgi:hypothetical protein